jgi:hypothetical protein
VQALERLEITRSKPRSGVKRYSQGGQKQHLFIRPRSDTIRSSGRSALHSLKTRYAHASTSGAETMRRSLKLCARAGHTRTRHFHLLQNAMPRGKMRFHFAAALLEETSEKKADSQRSQRQNASISPHFFAYRLPPLRAMQIELRPARCRSGTRRRRDAGRVGACRVLAVGCRTTIMASIAPMP